jgi:hypothetical protein
MPASPPPRTKPPEGGLAGDAERSTPIPEFDLAAFARESEMRQRAAASTAGEPTLEQALRLHLDGKHEDALFLLARLLDVTPLHPEATRLSADCRAALERQCLSAIGSESTVLIAAVSNEELKRYALDHVSGFLLSLLDGDTRVENVLDISGMPRLLVLRHLHGLLERGIIVVASGLRRR